MMCFLGCDEKYNQGRCSDFEFFAEWERILPLCAGSVSSRLYGKQLSLLELSFDRDEQNRPSAIELWRIGNKALCEETKCKITRKYREMMKKQGIDVLEYVTNIANQGTAEHSQTALPLELLSKELLSELGTCPHLLLRVSSRRYVRPDRYHATLAWQGFLRDEKINEEERFVLELQLLIEVLLLLKKKKIFVTLHLCSQDASICEQVISYLKENRLMEGEIRCSLFLDTPMSEILSICRLSEKNIRVLPELVLRPSDLGAPLAPALREIATVYPIGGLRYGRLLSDSPSLSLAAEEELREKIDAFLLDEGVFDEKRQEILNNIFNS
ncbi:MAG: hypothetical protein J6Q82_06090 [Clostridia bacterium]|nr:hypothetical protein [Clostridia bacterium]